jgi:hypothetical protein
MKYALKNLDNEKLNGQRVTLDEAVWINIVVIFLPFTYIHFII